MTHSIDKQTEPRPWLRIDVAMLALALFVALGTRSITIDRPFHRDPEGCGSFYGTLARNYFRYGVIKTFAVPIQNAGISPAAPVFYPNHPPLLPLLVAGTYAVSGWNPTSGDVPPDWQTRLSTTLATLACVATIFVMLRNRAGLRAATFAAILFALMPMTLVFGSQPDVINTQLDFFALLTVAAYLRFHDSPSLSRFLLLCLAFFPAAATDWPAFHLVIVLGIHFIATRPLRQWPWIIAFGLFVAMLFFLLYAQVVAVTHDWQWMSKLVRRRALSSQTDANHAYTMWEWIEGAVRHHAIGRHTDAGFRLLAVWLLLAMTRLRSSRSTQLILLLLGWAILHIVIGRQGVFVHEWWWWPLTPAIAMAGGVAIDWILKQPESRGADRRIATSVAVVMICIFGIHNIRAAVAELRHPYGMSKDPALDYSVTEMGAAIRAAAPLGEAVMLAEDDKTLSLWFYGDRAIKQKIWSVDTFESRLHDGVADLQFDLTEQCPTAPAAMIVPKAYLSEGLKPLTDYLDSRYPKTESAKFITYALNGTKTN
ncbi:MAG: hypothetical protein H7Z14_14905 [Anaerolineae bacterium]|nr:hypothetical protein [Phycisphaerae bacterium]